LWLSFFFGEGRPVGRVASMEEQRLGGWSAEEGRENSKGEGEVD